MGRKKYLKKSNVYRPVSRGYSLRELDALQAQIEVQRDLEIQKALTSSDPQAILAAQAYIQRQQQHQDGLKSYIFDPNLESLNTNGYRVPLKGVTFDTMRKMAKTPVIQTVIGTRKDQVAGFAEPVDNEQERGWKIRRKKGLFQESVSEELTDDDKRVIEEITKFIMNGGNVEDNKWDFEGFEEVLREITDDSLTVDQLCMEMVYSRGGELRQFYPVDSTTIRLVDTAQTVQLAAYTKPVKGYWPKYCQVWEDNICAFYYPWELTFGIRNKTTSIKANGYGQPELEDLVQIVTWLLFGMQYNGNFFSQGSNPKGFFSIEGNVPPSALNDFKQMWRNTQSGVWNAHKIPVIETGGSKVNWTNMMGGNMKDMEFHKWLEFLIVLTCCIYTIDPTECGFNLEGMHNTFGQDGQQARLKHSQTKGLTPILKLIQRIITKYMVEPLNEDFEFVFCGVETDDQEKVLEMDVKKIQNGFMSLEDGFRKYSDREFDPEKDTILNNVYQQIKQSEMMGGGMMNGMVDGMGGGEPIMGEEQEPNPFEKSLLNYLSGDIKNGWTE